MLLTILLALSEVSYAKASKRCDHKFTKELCANIDFKAPISRKNDAKFILSFVDESGKTFTKPITPNIKLWMVMKNGHEHGSDKVNIKQLGPNKFLVSNVWFLMLGQWSLKININYDGQSKEADIPVCLRKDVAQSKLGVCKK